MADRLLRSRVRILPGALVFLCCECCLLSGRGFCDEPITLAEEFYRLWCVVVRELETSEMRRPWRALGRSATRKRIKAVVVVPIVPQDMAAVFATWNHPTTRKFFGIFFEISSLSHKHILSVGHTSSSSVSTFISHSILHSYTVYILASLKSVNWQGLLIVWNMKFVS